ncbi:MAG TPA: T9SS type A sorting domain-containing protein [Bacteroidia bacterium]|jgi:hypothetical protein|nr:T9SS type A sorting domain-containing protein [Bacteroidia bacterium]
MKKIITVSILFFGFSLFTPCFSQDWFSVDDGLNGPPYAMAVYNFELYVAGSFTEAAFSPVNNIAKYSSSSWTDVGSGIKGYYGVAIEALMVYNGNLYAGGAFDSAGGMPASNIAMWNGTNWSAVGTGISGAEPIVFSMIVYNGNLIVAGYFDSAGGQPAKNIAMWNGTSWSAMGAGLNDFGLSLEVYNSELYVGGNFDSAGGKPCNAFATWNGSIWSACGQGLKYNGRLGGVSALCTYNGLLYVGGFFDSAGGHPATMVATWNGTAWDSVISEKKLNSGGEIRAMIVAGGRLILGGVFDTVNGVKTLQVATWDGTTWDSLGSGFNIPDSGVYTLAYFQNDVYAGGDIKLSGRTTVRHIASWNHPTGISPIEENENVINVFPNPSSGIFTIAFVGAQNFVPKNIEVFNMLGEKVFTAIRQLADDNLINLSNQPSGVYFYRVVSDKGDLIGEGKLVLQK